MRESLDFFLMMGSTIPAMRGIRHRRLNLCLLMLFLTAGATAFASDDGSAPVDTAPRFAYTASARQGALISPSSAFARQEEIKSDLLPQPVAPETMPEGSRAEPQQCYDVAPPAAPAPSEDRQVTQVTIQGDRTQIVYDGNDVPDHPSGEPELSFPPDNSTALAAIDRNVSLFAVRLRERFSIWLERSARYMEIMREILREKQLPEELVFLPFVESGFNVHAYSTARAVGPWQFIEATAKRYGLVVDWWRDERKDPVKSTEAAAAYLSDLYSMFGSWHLALAAYNAGEGRIMKALKRSNAEDYWSLLHTTQIRDETKEYVPRFFAAKRIAHSPEDFGFSDLDYHDPLDFDEVVVKRATDIEVIASCAGTSVKTIRDLNPELRRWSTPPNVDRYTVRIPRGKEDTFYENLSRLPHNRCFSYDGYVVKKGDTITKIARRLNVPAGALIALNGFTGLENPTIGSTIKIPPRDKFTADLDDKAAVKRASFTKQTVKQKNGRAPLKPSKRAVGKSKDKIGAKRI